MGTHRKALNHARYGADTRKEKDTGMKFRIPLGETRRGGREGGGGGSFAGRGVGINEPVSLGLKEKRQESKGNMVGGKGGKIHSGGENLRLERLCGWKEKEKDKLRGHNPIPIRSNRPAGKRGESVVVKNSCFCN